MGAPPIRWTAEMDAQLTAMRADGLSWIAIGKVMGIAESSASARGRFLRMPKLTVKYGPELPHHAEHIRQAVAVGTAKSRIARDLGISESRVYDICKRIGVTRAVEVASPRTKTRGQNGRECLPAGHPTSWGLITAGTVLDGAPYA